MINTRKVASFIDDIIVGMEEKEGYNEVIRIVIRLKEIKMKEKVKGVSDWLTFKGVEDIQKFFGTSQLLLIVY